MNICTYEENRMKSQYLLLSRVLTLETSQFEMGWLNALAPENAVERDQRSVMNIYEEENTTSRLTLTKSADARDIPIRDGLVECACFTKRCGKGSEVSHEHIRRRKYNFKTYYFQEC